MPNPSYAEYTDALQLDLGIVLSDPMLGRGTLRMHGPGLPVAHSGNFALTFEVLVDGRRFAVRCFHKQSDSLHARYDAISRHLGRIHSPYFVGFQFHPSGITTESGTYPVVRMDWAEGQSLAAFVAQHRNDVNALQQLRVTLRRVAQHLRDHGIAHGDIQPTNMVVQGASSLKLIDYDGMFVPGLASLCASELGQRNFQHPGRRPVHFDASLDAFSFCVIDLALDALCKRPDLWDMTGSGDDAFLLRAADFADPSHSPVFSLLGRLPGLEQHARNLAAICVSPFHSIPSFEDFLAGRNIPAVRVIFSGDATAALRRPYVSPHEIVDATNFARCCAHVGDRVELIGRVVRVRRSQAPPMDGTRLRLEFGERSHDLVCLNIWPEALPRLPDVPDETWVGQWVSAVGLVEPVAIGHDGTQPQKDVSISITEPSQLQKISESEAQHRLRGRGGATRAALDTTAGVATDPVVTDAAPGRGTSRTRRVVEQTRPAPQRSTRPEMQAAVPVATLEALTAEIPEPVPTTRPAAVPKAAPPQMEEPDLPAVWEPALPPMAAEVLPAAEVQPALEPMPPPPVIPSASPATTAGPAVPVEIPAAIPTSRPAVSEPAQPEVAEPGPRAMPATPRDEPPAAKERPGLESTPAPPVIPAASPAKTAVAPWSAPARSAPRRASSRASAAVSGRRLSWLVAGLAAAILAVAVIARWEPSGTALGDRSAREKAAAVDRAVSPVDAPADGSPIDGAPAANRAPVELRSQQSLATTGLPIETMAGRLSVIEVGDGGRSQVVTLKSTVVPKLRDDRIELAHRAVYSDREVVVGFTQCNGEEAPCGLRQPFWLELSAGSPPSVRRVAGLWAGSRNGAVSATNHGVRIALGVWNGESRVATLTTAGDIEVARTREARGKLGRTDCDAVAASLEACARSRDCRSFAGGARLIPRTQRSRLTRIYHETTGFDAAAFKGLCVRSCQLGLTPSRAFIRANVCSGARAGQWSADDPAAGLFEGGR